MNRKTTQLIATVLGVFFVGVSIGGLTYFRCPSPGQLFILRSSLSLGAALLAFLITGFMQVKYYGIVSAGGGFALFALTYGFTPKLFTNPDNCNSPFSLTVFLRGKDGRTPLEGQGILRLLVGDELKQAPIDQEGACLFKNIPAMFMKGPVRYELAANGWQFNNGKVGLDDSVTEMTRTLFIEPDNSLCCVHGYVKAAGGSYLSQALVTVEGTTVSTNNVGYYELTIPEDKRKKEVLLIVSCNGYSEWRHTVLPADHDPIVVIMDKK